MTLLLSYFVSFGKRPKASGHCTICLRHRDWCYKSNAGWQGGFPQRQYLLSVFSFRETCPLLCQQNRLILYMVNVSLSQKCSSLYTRAVTVSGCYFSWPLPPVKCYPGMLLLANEYTSVCRKCGRVPDTLTHFQEQKTSW